MKIVARSGITFMGAEILLEFTTFRNPELAQDELLKKFKSFMGGGEVTTDERNRILALLDAAPMAHASEIAHDIREGK